MLATKDRDSGESGATLDWSGETGVTESYEGVTGVTWGDWSELSDHTGTIDWESMEGFTGTVDWSAVFGGGYTKEPDTLL